jgi:hypothetical protein
VRKKSRSGAQRLPRRPGVSTYRLTLATPGQALDGGQQIGCARDEDLSGSHVPRIDEEERASLSVAHVAENEKRAILGIALFAKN